MTAPRAPSVFKSFLEGALKPAEYEFVAYKELDAARPTEGEAARLMPITVLHLRMVPHSWTDDLFGLAQAMEATLNTVLRRSPQGGPAAQSAKVVVDLVARSVRPSDNKLSTISFFAVVRTNLSMYALAAIVNRRVLFDVHGLWLLRRDIKATPELCAKLNELKELKPCLRHKMLQQMPSKPLVVELAREEAVIAAMLYEAHRLVNYTALYWRQQQ